MKVVKPNLIVTWARKTVSNAVLHRPYMSICVCYMLDSLRLQLSRLESRASCDLLRHPVTLNYIPCPFIPHTRFPPMQDPQNRVIGYSEGDYTKHD